MVKKLFVNKTISDSNKVLSEIIVLNNPKKIIQIFPPSNFSSEKFDGGNRTLSFQFKDEGVMYLVDCKTSLCNNKYVFTSDEYGITKFDKLTEMYLGSSKPMNEKYFLFLKRSLLAWKKHFNHF